MSWLRRRAFAWAPCLLLAVLAAPSVTHRLPNYESELGENYQPLRALKFYASGGQAYHKYGPVPNFLLGPTYAASMAWWWATGSFDGPSQDFPYGFREPLHQISWLLLHGRALFMLLFLGLSWYALLCLRRAGEHPLAIALGFAFCIATNYAAAGFVANTRPDGPMFAFALASMGVYVLILREGLTLRRGVLLSTFAVLAISSKELAGAIYILPYLWLGWRGWSAAGSDPQRRRRFARDASWSVATGVAGYLLLNVLYAPAAWAARMEHWLADDGIDSAVWGGLGSGLPWGGHLLNVGAALLNTLGPGGLCACAMALAALAIARPARDLELLVPFASLMSLGILPLGYTADRFLVPAAVTLLPAVVVGLRVLLSGRRPALALGTLLALLVLNAWWATFAWHRIADVPGALIEEHLAASPPGGPVNRLDVYPRSTGKSRLSWLGFDVDERSIQQISDATASERPQRIYATLGLLGFLDDARERFPARAEMLERDGLDVQAWRGVESLGYERVRVLRPELPPWFPFRWMPAAGYLRGTGEVYVFERTA